MKTKTVIRIMLVFVTVFILLTSVAYGQADKDTLSRDRLGQDNKITIGETAKIHSDILNEDGNILIYLLDNYANSQMRYTVIYLLDGNYFFLPTSGMVEFLSKINKAPKMIVVAIINTNRFRDFSPPTSDIADPNSSDTGSAARFSAFLKNELMPYMNKNYRTETYNIFIGHSLGGLFIIYTLDTTQPRYGQFMTDWNFYFPAGFIWVKMTRENWSNVINLYLKNLDLNVNLPKTQSPVLVVNLSEKKIYQKSLKFISTM